MHVYSFVNFGYLVMLHENVSMISSLKVLTWQNQNRILFPLNSLRPNSYVLSDLFKTCQAKFNLSKSLPRVLINYLNATQEEVKKWSYNKLVDLFSLVSAKTGKCLMKIK